MIYAVGVAGGKQHERGSLARGPQRRGGFFRRHDQGRCTRKAKPGRGQFIADENHFFHVIPPG